VQIGDQAAESAGYSLSGYQSFGKTEGSMAADKSCVPLRPAARKLLIVLQAVGIAPEPWVHTRYQAFIAFVLQMRFQINTKLIQ
jgi:hypothetical protein